MFTMKTTMLGKFAMAAAVVGALGVSAMGQAYTPGYGAPYTAQPSYIVAPPAAFSAAQIDQLTAPIALYPDPLLAVVLSAATDSGEVVAAAQWDQAGAVPDEATISQLPWQPSIQALLHYPNVLQWLAQNTQWTQTLGTAFTYQQADVMASIQRWRIQAQLAGTLATTPQQVVIVQDQCVRILPADPGVVYVPYYDPRTIYLRGRHDGLTFGFGGSFGGGFDWDFDWHNHDIIRRPGGDAGRWNNQRGADVRSGAQRDADQRSRRPSGGFNGSSGSTVMQSHPTAAQHPITIQPPRQVQSDRPAITQHPTFSQHPTAIQPPRQVQPDRPLIMQHPTVVQRPTTVQSPRVIAEPSHQVQQPTMAQRPARDSGPQAQTLQPGPRGNDNGRNNGNAGRDHNSHSA